MPIRVFFSYSSVDEEHCKQLLNHLSILRRQGVIEEWHFREIIPGEEWDGKIREELNRAELILFLVSSDFLASDYCYDVEVERALERRTAGEAQVVPIIVRPVDYQGSRFEELQLLPTDAVPVTRWDDADEAWVSVAKGIRAVCENLTDLISEAIEPQGDQEYLEIREEDYGILDFQAGFLVAMERATEYQEAIGEDTVTLTGQFQETQEKVERLASADPGTRAKRAQLLAGKAAAVMVEYAKKVESSAEGLDEAWADVTKYFPKMLEAVDPSTDQDLESLLELRQTIHENTDTVDRMIEVTAETRTTLGILGKYSAALKHGSRRVDNSLDGLTTVYWSIREGMDQMIVRIDGIIDQMED